MRTKADIFRIFWALLLAAALFVSARESWRVAGALPDIAENCDEFGYLMMAKQFCGPWGEGVIPAFALQSSKSSLLVEHFKNAGYPSDVWSQAVGPHAFHYFPRTDKIGAQYPPGTGAILSLFSEGKRVSSLNRANIVTLLGVGIGLLVLSTILGSSATAGIVAFAIHAALVMLVRLQHRSYSVNALVIPTLISAIALTWAHRKKNLLQSRWSSWVAGGMSGLSLLVRVSWMLEFPATFFAVPRGRRWFWILGCLLIGVIPLAFFQNQLAGAPWLSTYSEADAQAPSLAIVLSNLNYYGWGSGSKHSWAVLGVALGVWANQGFGVQIRVWYRSALLALGLPFIFFITHPVRTPYYLYPAILCANSVLIAALFAAGDSVKSWPRWRVGLAHLPGFGVLLWAVILGANPSPPGNANRVVSEAPAELRDAQAWIWADRLSGSFWYYYDLPAFRLGFINNELRHDTLSWVDSRRDPQYLVVDGPDTAYMFEQLRAWGANLESRGTVLARPYYRIHWKGSPKP